nr:uncharacterized protein LOC128685389 [Cherax quadricarinatus]
MALNPFIEQLARYVLRHDAGGKPCVRLLGVTRSTKPPAGWCHLWFSTQQPPVVTRITIIDHLDYQGLSSDRQMPFMFTCPLPSQVAHLQPAAVSLVHQPCQPATTLLQVTCHHPPPGNLHQTLLQVTCHHPSPRNLPPPSSTVSCDEQSVSWVSEVSDVISELSAVMSEVSAVMSKLCVTRFIFHRAVKGWVPAVCGPALYYYHEDFSKRMVEWLEILRAEGIGKVFLYVTDVHPNLEKVLKYYEDDGFLHLTGYSYPPPYINEPSLRRLWTLVEQYKMFAQENIYFTDCLLRHMHQYRFIAHYDPDEIPILPNHHNYTHFLEHMLTRDAEKKLKPAGYKLQWNYFYNDLNSSSQGVKEVPEYLWALRHTLTPTQPLKPTPGTFKSLFDMDVVRAIYSHSTLLCKHGGKINTANLSAKLTRHLYNS